MTDGTDQSDQADQTEPETADDAKGADVDSEELQEIEEERERRLAPDNRPEMSEVDNSGVTLPTLEEWKEREREGEAENEEAAGTSDPSQTFRENPPSEEEAAEMAEERERRLAPENRPDGVEVDNTGRTFEDGHFVD